MGCLPGMPCYGGGLTVYPRGCGLDPCKTHKTSTDLVFYTGPNLPCIDIGTCDNMSLALQKIDTAICPINMTTAVLNVIATNTSMRNMFCNLVLGCIPPPTTTTTSSTSTTSTSTSTSTSTTSTSTSTSTSTTSTSTSTSTSTTSTSTTPAPLCYTYDIENIGVGEITVNFTNCSGIPTTTNLKPGQIKSICAIPASITPQVDLTISAPTALVCDPVSVINVDNSSLSGTEILLIELDGTTVGGFTYPIGAGQTSSTYANGTYLLEVTIVDTIGTQSVTVIDTTGTSSCQNISGDGTYTFPGVVLNDSSPITDQFTIILRDVAC